MTAQEMDICLNISTEPAVSLSNRKKKETYKPTNFVKRLTKESVEKKENKTSNELKSISSNQSGGINRVKQKALTAIITKKLQKTNIVSNSQNTQKLSNSQFKLKNKNNAPTTVTNKLYKVPSATNVQSTDIDKVVTETNNNASKEPIISFVKVSKKSLSKTVIAKKRNVSEVSSKKSLSEIFSNQVTKKNIESDLSDVILNVKTNDNDMTQITHEKSTIEQFPKNFDRIKQSRKLDININNRKKEQRKDITGYKVQKNESSDKIYQGYKKQTGKSSSLFKNNPEVPNIGQRLVKPISETVFTKINFSDLDVHPFMVSNLEQNMNITKLTTVQQMAIPQIFSGKDVLIRSQTGSGKTLAYAIPIIECLHKIRPKLTRSSGLSALVVVPTRELALQTYECFLKLRKPFTWIVPGYLVGGEKRKAEKARLRKGCNILVGTPGRLLDHIRHTEALKLVDVKHFVLDEADRMLDAGYEKDIAGIVDALKGINIKSDNSSYDPMEMLKQNKRKVFTDEETTLPEENHKQEQSSNGSEISKSENNNNNDINNIEDLTRQTYHSNSESDSEEDDYPVKLKKKKEKKSFIKPAKEKEEDLKTSQDLMQTPPKRRTILLSATLTQAVEKLAGLAMHNPVFVDAAKENLVIFGGDEDQINEDYVVPQSVRQSYVVTPPKLRMVTLSAFIVDRCKQSGHNKMLIFMATQDMVDYYTEILSVVLTKSTDEEDEESDPLVDVEFLKLHGNMSQKERMEVFKNFRLANSSVLLCTDVAARGLDLPKVDCVVQYTGPLSTRDYVHRIGRTARAGTSGSAVIFLTPPEVEFVRMLESKRIRINQVDMENILGKLIGPLSKYHSVQEAAIALQRDFEALLLEDKKLHGKACKAYVSWMRFYSTYPHDMREIFNRKELHLGHYAKSFGLSDRPQQIGEIGKKLCEQGTKIKPNNRLTIDRPDRKTQGKQDGVHHNTRILKKVKMLNVSEYDSGLPVIKKPKKF